MVRKVKTVRKTVTPKTKKVTPKVTKEVKTEPEETPVVSVKQMILKKRDQRFKMIIPKKVEEKIRIACALCPNKEWSGALFYTYTGDFENQNLVITCEDILVKDIGSAAYTEWKIDAEVAGYMVDNDLMDCQQGIVHSHDTMSAFFSGTDQATLLSEGQDRNNIVSLIVNNAGVYEAAITRMVNSKLTLMEKGNYKFFGEKEVQEFERISEEEDSYVEWFMLDVEKEETSTISDFISSFNKLKSPKPVGFQRSNNYGYNSYDLYDDDYNYGVPRTSAVNPVKPVTTPKSTYQPYSYPKVNNTPVNNTPKIPFTKPKNIEHDLLIEDLALQLATGDITASSASFISLEYWVEDSMVETFARRFGRDIGSDSPFAAWVNTVLDFMMDYTEDSELSKFNRMDRSTIIIEGLKKRFSELTHKNIYVTCIIRQLDYVL